MKTVGCKCLDMMITISVNTEEKGSKLKYTSMRGETRAEIFPDNAIKRELRPQQVRCTNDGCEWKGQFIDYEEHYEICDHQLIKCIKRGCDTQIKRGDLAIHLETECDMRAVKCKYCKQDVAKKSLKGHLEEQCNKFPVACDLCGITNIPRDMLLNHQDAEVGDCTKKLKPCAYANIGCKTSVPMQMVSEHMDEAKVEHIDLIYRETSKINSSIATITRENDLSGIRKTTSENQTKIEVIHKDVKQLEDDFKLIIKQQRDTDVSKGGIKSLAPTIDRQMTLLDESKNKITVLDTKVTTYEGIVAVLNSQIERDAQVVQILERQRKQDRELLESLERKIKAQDRIIALKDVALAEQDLRIQSLEMASYDGVLAWKINNFHQKRQDALSGRTTSIYSPCFYTSRHGYKMCARIYLNGDGMGKGNHVSLFFVIMKGPFDALLRWPFRQKVTFMLLDQNNREHVIDAFRPDPTSNSFKRPTNDMNIASGCPLFMPISQLDSSQHAYVKDDAMFLKVIVDTSDIA
ncbi:TNF receptor-associated factor 2-like isoform X2 [Glandiceps talaboti]